MFFLVRNGLASAVLLVYGLCLAQTNTETFSQLQFNFNNPGARAAGIGGAFISIADDATAAEANPAGLTVLIEPEISFELKRINYTRNIFNFDDEGDAANFTLIDKDFDDSVISPAFASFVYPAGRLILSGFRHELVNFKSEYSTNGTFIPGRSDGSAYFPVASNTDMKVTNWGAAAGYKINEKVSIGLAAGISQFTINSSLRRLAGGVTTNMSTIDDNDANYFLNFGIIFRPDEKIAIGGTYKKRPEFKVEHTLEDFGVGFMGTEEINFKVPSALGIGASYRPTDVLTFALDVTQVKYSDLTSDFVLTSLTGVFKPEEFSAEDGVEMHFGGEYVGFLNEIGYVLRAGIFIEPSSSIEFTGDPNDIQFVDPSIFDENFTADDARLNRQVWQTLFQKGDSTTHFTFGLGLILSRQFQIDLAGSISNKKSEFSTSLVYRLN